MVQQLRLSSSKIGTISFPALSQLVPSGHFLSFDCSSRSISLLTLGIAPYLTTPARQLCLLFCQSTKSLISFCPALLPSLQPIVSGFVLSSAIAFE
jgi:hypothetical protein